MLGGMMKKRRVAKGAIPYPGKTADLRKPGSGFARSATFPREGPNL